MLLVVGLVASGTMLAGAPARIGSAQGVAEDDSDEGPGPGPGPGPAPNGDVAPLSMYEITPEVPDAMPARFAVMPFENRTSIRALDYLRAGGAFTLAEKAELLIGLAPAYGPLVVEGPALSGPVSAETVASFGAAKQAEYVFTGWVMRPDWKLQMGISLWRVTASEPASSAAASPGAATATLIAEIVGKDDFSAVHRMIGAALVSLSASAGWRVRPDVVPALSADPTRDLYAFTLLGRGLGNLIGIDGLVNLAAAARDLDKAVFIDPFMVEAQRLDGVVRGLEGKASKASGKYNYAIDLRPTYYPAIRAAAEANASAGGKAEVARELYDRMVRLRPWDLEARFGLGNALWETGDAGGALRELERVVTRRPGHLAARRVLVLVLASRGSSQDLVTQLEEVVKLAPDDHAARLDLGAAYVAVGREAEAVAAYEAVVSAQPDSVMANKLLGDVLRRVGRTDEAIEHFTRLIKLAPEDPRSYFLLGAMYIEAGNLSEAKKMYQRTQRSKAHVGPAFTNLGAIAWQEGKLDDALWYLVRAVQKRPRSAIARYDLALVLLARGDRARAATEVQAALRLEPGHAGAQALARTLEVAAPQPVADAVAAAPGASQALPGRPGGAIEIEVVYGPAELFRGRIDRLYALEQKMDVLRAEVGRAVHALLRATGETHGRICPVRAIAQHYVDAEKAAASFRERGALFEDEYMAIARLDALGETASLTPDYRWRVNQVRARYHTALLDYRELRAVMKEQVASELRYRRCTVPGLQAAAARPKSGEPDSALDDPEDLAGPDTPEPTEVAKPAIDQPSVVGATVTFFVDNRTCPQPLRVYVDGEQRGVVPPSARAALQSQAGRRAMCLIPSTSRAICGDRGTVRTAYLHDGWSMTMHCMSGTKVLEPEKKPAPPPTPTPPSDPAEQITPDVLPPE